MLVNYINFRARELAVFANKLQVGVLKHIHVVIVLGVSRRHWIHIGVRFLKGGLLEERAGEACDFRLFSGAFHAGKEGVGC